MTDKSRETLSALMDGEASEIEIHRLLREIEQQPGLRNSWISYQQIRSVIRNEPWISREAHEELATRLRASIAAEEQYAEAPARAPRLASLPYFKPAAGFAVAASLVVVVLFGLQTTRVGSPAGLDGGVAQESGSAPGNRVATDPATRLPALRSGPTRFVSSAPAVTDREFATDLPAPAAQGAMEDSDLRELDEERMRQVRAYLMRHDRVARMNPYARVVTNPGDRGK